MLSMQAELDSPLIQAERPIACGSYTNRTSEGGAVGSMARPERFELPTYSSGGCRSIQLSYGRVFTVYIEPLRSAEIPRVLCRRVG